MQTQRPRAKILSLLLVVSLALSYLIGATPAALAKTFEGGYEFSFIDDSGQKSDSATATANGITAIVTVDDISSYWDGEPRLDFIVNYTGTAEESGEFAPIVKSDGNEEIPTMSSYGGGYVLKGQSMPDVDVIRWPNVRGWEFPKTVNFTLEMSFEPLELYSVNMPAPVTLNGKTFTFDLGYDPADDGNVYFAEGDYVGLGVEITGNLASGMYDFHISSEKMNYSITISEYLDEGTDYLLLDPSIYSQPALIMPAESIDDLTVTVTQNTAPLITINTQPAASTTVTQDDPLEISVTASITEGATLFYRWQMSTTSATEDFFSLPDERTATYDVNTSASGTYYYRCVVRTTSNVPSVMSNVAKVIVNPKPPNVIEMPVPFVSPPDTINLDMGGVKTAYINISLGMSSSVNTGIRADQATAKAI